VTPSLNSKQVIRSEIFKERRVNLMHAQVWKGQLTLVNTDKNWIRIIDQEDGQPIEFDIDENTNTDDAYEILIGGKVEVAAVDGRAIYIKNLETGW
jgi:hypothetical protein